ncbi:oligopeptidase B, partial [Pseudoalteromonas piscicida]
RATAATVGEVEQWEEFVATRADVLIEGFERFNRDEVLRQREQGQIGFVVHDYHGQSYHLGVDDACYFATGGNNPAPN